MMVQSKLRRQYDRVRSEPGLKKNVIVVAGLVVTALIAGGWILGNQGFSTPWSDKVELSAEFEAVPGIAPGNGQEVRISGVIVGNISGAEVNKKGRSQLKMELEPGHRIYSNASLVLRPKSPLNEMYVTIDPGGPPGKLLTSGATLPVTNTTRPVQVDEVLGSLDDDARGALTALLGESDQALASAPEKLPKGLDGLTKVIGDLRPVSAEMDTRRETLKRLVSAVSEISGAVGTNDARLVDLANSLDTTLQTLSDKDGSLDASLGELSPLVSRLNSSTAAVQELSAALNPTLRDVHSSAENLPKALSRVGDTANTLSETVKVARPVVAKAKPVVADLRPFVAELQVALPSLRRTTMQLDPITSSLVKYLPDLGAFMVNTRSVMSLRDGNGGILRGMLVVGPTDTLPTDLFNGLAPEEVEGAE